MTQSLFTVLKQIALHIRPGSQFVLNECLCSSELWTQYILIQIKLLRWNYETTSAK